MRRKTWGVIQPGPGVAPTHFPFLYDGFDVDADWGSCGKGDEHFETELLPFASDRIGHAGLTGEAPVIPNQEENGTADPRR